MFTCFVKVLPTKSLCHTEPMQYVHSHILAYKITVYAANVISLLCMLPLILVNSRPTRNELLDHVVVHVTPLWHDLGIKLFNEDQQSDLDNIKSSDTDTMTRCKEMFWHWLKTDTSASWKKLIQALQSPAIKLVVVADDLEKMLTGN